ncbi:MAG: hypothetical protein FWB71_05000 [Defluviitaleaceae bacterium]|nr:hypothetical protein [Defluviitaleaceae bacterium]
MDEGIKAILQHILELARGASARVADELLVCEDCETSWLVFRSSGKLGCAACYEAFRENMAEALNNIHSANRHTGKLPKGQAHMFGDLLVKRELTEKQRLLKLAIEAEDYALAATHRDVISQLMEKMAKDGEEGKEDV